MYLFLIVVIVLAYRYEVSGQCVCFGGEFTFSGNETGTGGCLYLPVLRDTKESALNVPTNESILACIDGEPEEITVTAWKVHQNAPRCDYSPHAVHEGMLIQVDDAKCEVESGDVVDTAFPYMNVWMASMTNYDEQYNCVIDCKEELNETRLGSAKSGVVFENSDLAYANPKFVCDESNVYDCVYRCDISSFCNAVTYDYRKICRLFGFADHHIDAALPRSDSTMVILTHRLNGHLVFHNTRIDGSEPCRTVFTRTDVECEDLCLGTTNCVASQFGWGECSLFRYPNRFRTVSASGYTVFVDKRPDNVGAAPSYHTTSKCLKVIRDSLNEAAVDCVSGAKFSGSVFGLPQAQDGSPVLTTVSGQPGVCSSEGKMIVYPTEKYEVIDDCVTSAPLYSCEDDNWEHVRERCDLTISGVRYTNLARGDHVYPSYVNRSRYTCGFSCVDHQGIIVRKENGGWACVVIESGRGDRDPAYFTDLVSYRSVLNAITDLTEKNHVVHYHDSWNRAICSECVNPPCKTKSSSNVYEIKYFNGNSKNTGGFTIYNQRTDNCFLYDGVSRTIPRMVDGIVSGSKFLHENPKHCVMYKAEARTAHDDVGDYDIEFTVSSAPPRLSYSSSICIVFLLSLCNRGRGRSLTVFII